MPAFMITSTGVNHMSGMLKGEKMQGKGRDRMIICIVCMVCTIFISMQASMVIRVLGSSGCSVSVEILVSFYAEEGGLMKTITDCPCLIMSLVTNIR